MFNRKSFKHEDILKCDLCTFHFNEYNEPKFLHCYKTICSKCELSIQNKAENRDRQINCPFCLNKQQIPDDGLPLNERIYALLKSTLIKKSFDDEESQFNFNLSNLTIDSQAKVVDHKQLVSKLNDFVKTKSDDDFVKNKIRSCGRGILAFKTKILSNNKKNEISYSVYDTDDNNDGESKFEDIEPAYIKKKQPEVLPNSADIALKSTRLIEETKTIVTNNSKQTKVVYNPSNYNGILVNKTIIDKKIAEMKKEDEESINKLLESNFGKQKEPSPYLMRFSYYERFQKEYEKNNPKPPTPPPEVENKEDEWIPLDQMPMLINGEFY